MDYLKKTETVDSGEHTIPSVSVVIPAYNAEHYLGEALQSVLDQSWRDYEVIVVNDGSTDGTGSVLDTFMRKDSRIVRIDQPNSGKPSIARNRGIRASRGEYIAFLDADDIWLPSKLERSIEALRSTRADLCYHDFYRMQENGTFFPQSRWTELDFLESATRHLDKCGEYTYIMKPSFLGFAASSYNPIQTSGVTVKKTTLIGENTWFPEDMILGEDDDLWYRIFFNNFVVLINQSLSAYRKHSGSITALNEKTMLLSVISASENNLERYHSRMTIINVLSIKHKLSFRYQNLAYLYRLEGDYNTAYQFYLRSFKFSPSPRKLASLFRIIMLLIRQPTTRLWNTNK